MSGHTPGPWRATGEVWSGSSQTLPAGILSYRINHKGQEETVAQVWPPYVCDHASKGYARHAADLMLMLAAPELLESLENMIGIIELEGIKGPGVDKAREAIKKAKGE